MIKNTSAWIKAYSRFGGFQINTPTWPHEKHVEKYHSIISDFERATDEDFSAFKIRDNEMDHIGPANSFFEPPIAGYRYCDPVIFRTRVSGLVRYLIALIELHTGRPASSPTKQTQQQKAATSNTYNIGTMLGSQLVAGSANTSIRNTLSAKGQEFRNLVQQIKDAVPTLPLDQTTADQMKADIATIEAQIESPAPKYMVIGESISSIRSILEGMAANVLTSALLSGIGKFFT